MKDGELYDFGVFFWFAMLLDAITQSLPSKFAAFIVSHDSLKMCDWV